MSYERDFGRVPENTSVRITGTIVDANGDGISSADLDSCELTVYDVVSRAVDASYDDFDILSSVDTDGNLDYTLPADALVMYRDKYPEEPKHILVRWTYNGGDDSGWFRYKLLLVNELSLYS